MKHAKKKEGKKAIALNEVGLFLVYAAIHSGETVETAVKSVETLLNIKINISKKISQEEALTLAKRKVLIIRAYQATGIIKANVATWKAVESIINDLTGTGKLLEQKLQNEVDRKAQEVEALQIKIDSLSQVSMPTEEVKIFLEYIGSTFFSLINSIKKNTDITVHQIIDRGLIKIMEEIKSFKPKSIVQDEKHGRKRAQSKKL